MEKKVLTLQEFYFQKDIRDLPIISVIMPVYNAGKYLKRTMYSIVNQSYSNIEIICVNDGSTDCSLDILNIFAANDKRIKIINQQNSGPSGARNAGLDAATGKYISFVDADDELDINMYKQLVWRAETEDADVVVFGGKAEPDRDVPEWINSRLKPSDATYEGASAVRCALFYVSSCRPFLWLHFIKRDLIESSPKLRMRRDLDVGEDQAFQFLYFPRAKKVVVYSGQLYIYNWRHENSLMWKNNAMRVGKFKKHLKLVETVLKSWKDNNIADPLDELVFWLIDLLYDDLMSFPKYLQIEFSKNIVSIIEKYTNYNQDTTYCEVKEKVEEIRQLSLSQKDIDKLIEEDLSLLKNQLDAIEKEINDTIHSGAFKLGRFLTKRKNRIDIDKIISEK